MEGSHLKSQLKRKFGLTDEGAQAVKRAAFISFLVNIGYMALMLIAMHYGDNVLQGIQKPVWYYLGIIVVTLVILYVVIDREYVLTFNATYQESAAMRLEIADCLKELPLSYFSRHDLSDLAQTIMQDVTDIEHAMSHSIPRCIAYVFFLAATAVLLLIANPYLGIATLIPLVVGLLLMFLSQKAQKRWTEKYFWKMRETSEAFQETIELQREIKSNGYEEENYKALVRTLDLAERLRLRAELTQAMPLLLSTVIMKLSIGLVVIVSAWLLRVESIQLVYVLGFILASMRLVDAVGSMEDYFAEFFFLDARVQRLNELRNIETQKGKDVSLQNFDIELNNVSFSYSDDTQVIKNISFIAKQDQVTAIVGPSGCGKSTVLRLISRLYDYDKGSILIDGVDIHEISTNALFDKVSFVFQDVILFNTSVLENIRLGRPGATDEEVIKAARLANCEEFISKMPDGYDSLVGENGSKLSGGERQRISIARALLKNAPILLLDEISSSLDVENERKIQDALNYLLKGKTVIIVSHRLKSIEKADSIVVMDDGKIDSTGTHAQLLATSRLYRRMIEKSNMTERFNY